MIRKFPIYILLLALMLKALVPLGYMPNWQGKTMTVVLCSSGMTQTINLDDGIPHGQDHSKQTHPPCVFSINAQFQTPDLEFAPIAAPLNTALPVLRIADALTGLLHSPFSSRAPPSLV